MFFDLNSAVSGWCCFQQQRAVVLCDVTSRYYYPSRCSSAARPSHRWRRVACHIINRRGSGCCAVALFPSHVLTIIRRFVVYLRGYVCTYNNISACSRTIESNLNIIRVSLESRDVEFTFGERKYILKQTTAGRRRRFESSVQISRVCGL